MAGARVCGIGLVVAWLVAFSAGSAWAQSTYCGATPGSCIAGAVPTLGGKVRLDGRGVACTWECKAADQSVHGCTIGDEGTPCSKAGDANVPALTEQAVAGVTRDGEQVFDSFREHNDDILQTVEGEAFRVCRQRVQGQDDLDALAPFADRFGWGWGTSPTWATWQPLIEDSCYQITPGFDFRPIFLRTPEEFRSYLAWANKRDETKSPGSREVEAACLFLYESDATQRDRYIAGSPTGEQRNALGDWWIEETPPGGCPCDAEAWECGDDMCPPMAAGDATAGLSCGQPTCFSNLSAHWGPDVSTICDGVSFTQTNACDNSTRPATGTDTSSGCRNTPPPVCLGTWGPDPSTECLGASFTQTCSTDATKTRPATGTSTTGVCATTCAGTWNPDPSTVCDGLTFTQTCSTNSSLTQQATGTQTGCPPPPPVCTGTWGPATSTVCQGDSFTQTCSTDTTLTRPATGTSPSACGTPCTNRVVSPWSSWSPAPSTVCDGDSFTQTRTRSCTAGTAGTGTCTIACPTNLSETQTATGTSPSACGTPCTNRAISGWTTWSPSPSTVCSGDPFTQTRSRSCTPGSAGTGTCTVSCSGVSLSDSQPATGTNPGACITCTYPTTCGSPPSCYAPNSCGCSGQVDLGCGCGNSAPGPCGCNSQVDLGCGCGNPAPGACGCNGGTDLGCGCGQPAPGSCGCNSQVDLGCGCGNPAPGTCGCNGGTDLGCGCGQPAPGACGCNSQVDLGCGCGNPGPVCGTCGGSTCPIGGGCPPCPDPPCTAPTSCGSPGSCYAPVCGSCGGSTCSDGTCPDSSCGCSSPDLGCGCGNPAPGSCGCSTCPPPPVYTCGGLAHGTCPPGQACATVSCRTMVAGICIVHNFGCV